MTERMNKWYYGSNSPNGPIECKPLRDGYYTPLLSAVEKLLPGGNMGSAPPTVEITAEAMRTKQGAYMQYENDLGVQLIHLRRKYHQKRAALEQKLAFALTNTEQ